ncbi:hypothetical protein ILYODFUR_038537 [Ilyodon furcidens]|uniref:Uncharacterized protein n=1 Tax=Ilyodon furcidens TaxID=33524 RepID=A0ABV0UCA6_9TELE
MQQWQRQKKTSPKCRLRSHSLTRQAFLTEMLAEVEIDSLLEGQIRKGRIQFIVSTVCSLTTSGVWERSWQLAWHQEDLVPASCTSGASDISAPVTLTAYKCLSQM